MSTKTFQIDPGHSSIDFTVRHLVISKVRGGFDRFHGELVIDDDDITRSTVEVAIEVASVNTREEKRDAHLRSPDFFAAEKFPELTFRSTRIERGGADRLRVIGLLTIRDIAREVVLDVEQQGATTDPWGGTRAAWSARTAIDRRDFDIHFNIPLEGGGVVVGNKVEIGLEIEAVQAAAVKAA